MQVYLDLVVMLNFLVDFLLILGTNRLTGFVCGWKRAMGAAGVGGMYAGACLMPELRFLGNTLWRLVFLVLICVTAFGWNRDGIRRGAVFLLLSMALGGIASGAGIGDFMGVCICAGLLWLLCRLGFAGSLGQQEFVTAELRWGDKRISVTGLRDTGNTLRDPITGEQVLVCGADVGEELLGISSYRFRDPAGLMSSGDLPGVRLIPYRTVGQSGGMMVALRLQGTRINGKRCDPLVAFASQQIGGKSGYRMLTGGGI